MPGPNAYNFLSGSFDEHPDGYSVQGMLDWDNENLENQHNWIQWAFPLPEKSNFSAIVPVLTDSQVDRIRNSHVAQHNLVNLMWRMVDFYDQTTRWLVLHDHNHLRISRIIRSLRILCPPWVALTFYHFIMWKLACSKGGILAVNATSYLIWKREADRIVYPGTGDLLRAHTVNTGTSD